MPRMRAQILDRTLNEKDWEIILAVYWPPRPRKLITHFYRRSNAPTKVDYLATRILEQQYYNNVEECVNQVFIRETLPYALKVEQETRGQGGSRRLNVFVVERTYSS